MTQISDAPAKTRAQISQNTLRTDRWWEQPALVATLLTVWVAYATVHVLIGKWYFVPQYHYLTPFYSPCISGECTPGAASLGTWFGHLPPIIPYAVGLTPVRAGLPAELLLLPARLLPGVLAGASRLRGTRAAREVHRRDPVPAHHAEPAPVLLLHGDT